MYPPLLQVHTFVQIVWLWQDIMSLLLSNRAKHCLLMLFLCAGVILFQPERCLNLCYARLLLLVSTWMFLHQKHWLIRLTMLWYVLQFGLYKLCMLCLNLLFYFIFQIKPCGFSYIDFTLICQGDDPYFNKLIRILATRCMTQVTPLE
jgi:hypothetical protein